MITNEYLDQEIDRIITAAIKEDVGDGDHSAMACIPQDARGKAKLLVKDSGVLAGMEFARRVFEKTDPDLKMKSLLKDGDSIKKGEIAFYVEGSSRAILRAERLVLNGMQRMSAIATKTRAFVNQLEGTGAKILDTRKTTPGIRALEKWAVLIGGGKNHRFGLFDMIMLKDNHIDFSGGVKKAIQKTNRYLQDQSLSLEIVVEARSMKEIKEILEVGGVDRILIDNFNFQETKEAVKLIGGRFKTESSGGITLETARQYAECGVDYISSGALTHSVHNLDLSLKAME